jgi:hypothetical protein
VIQNFFFPAEPETQAAFFSGGMAGADGMGGAGTKVLKRADLSGFNPYARRSGVTGPWDYLFIP